MKVSLYSITPDPERLIIRIARVSNPENQNNPNIAGLIKFLLRNHHYSPFEHAVATFEIVTSRAIAAQLLRHRSFTFQEFSQRYAFASTFEPIEIRKQADKNRQSSTELIDPIMDNDMNASTGIIDTLSYAMQTYHRLINAGVAKESARFVLPLATTSTLYMSGTIRSWLTYLQLRTKEDVQKEHRDIALAIQEILRGELPTIFQALDMIEEEQQRHAAMILALKNRGINTPEDLLQAFLDTPVTLQETR